MLRWRGRCRRLCVGGSLPSMSAVSQMSDSVRRVCRVFRDELRFVCDPNSRADLAAVRSTARLVFVTLNIGFDYLLAYFRMDLDFTEAELWHPAER